MRSSFGKHIRATIFGGSHESHIGITIEGLPKNTSFDLVELQAFLDRRAPGRSPLSTPRKEPDKAILKSGAKTLDRIAIATGEPLTMIIENTDRRSGDYKQVANIPRPGHADFTAKVKYGDEINMAGGGPFSARMTAPLCIAGGIAIQLLRNYGIQIGAHIYSIGNICDQPINPVKPEAITNSFPVISSSAGDKMQQAILAAKDEGDSIGGVVEVFAVGLPPGLGGPMYEGVEGHLAPVFFGIPAVKGLEFGSGFQGAQLLGSENNDPFMIENGEVKTKTNRHGGILGGITSGMPLIARIALKPTPSIAKEQQSVDLITMEPKQLVIKGRHDPCIVPRAVPIAEAAMAIGIFDLIMEEKI